MNNISPDNRSLLPDAVGFTLVELLITLSVMTILLVLAIPSFRDMLMNNRVLAQTDALTSALNYARSSALTQNLNVVVCPLNAVGSTTCGGGWQNGWIVVSQPATGGPILLQVHNMGTNDPVLTANTLSVTFDSRGIATTQANFKSCDNRGGPFARSVNVLPTGFVQASSDMGLAAWDGSALTCP